MAKPPPQRIAILGAGPIGLEAALYARQIQWPFTLYERGRIGEHVQRWGHVRLFSPFGMNATSLGRAAVRGLRPNQALPADDALLTGREHLAAYLAPIAESLQGSVQTETQVLKISRRDHLKYELPGSSARAKSPFRMLVRDKQRERIEETDIVLDCTGTYGQHRWAGAGGIPAPGELQAESSIAYALDDILGERKNHYANKTTMIIGGGYSAATAACALADLGRDNHATWGVWIARGSQSTPLRRIANDPLKERDRLAVRANTLATRSDDNVEFHAGVAVEAIEMLGQDRGYKVTTRTMSGARTWEVERIIANVGYSPDTNLYRELQIHECFATLAPAGMAQILGPSKAIDGLKASPPAAESLRNPEPNYFILGAKSFGRNSSFLMRLGFEQVRDVFTLLTGNPGLNFYS